MALYEVNGGGNLFGLVRNDRMVATLAQAANRGRTGWSTDRFRDVTCAALGWLEPRAPQDREGQGETGRARRDLAPPRSPRSRQVFTALFAQAAQQGEGGTQLIAGLAAIGRWLKVACGFGQQPTALACGGKREPPGVPAHQ